MPAIFTSNNDHATTTEETAAVVPHVDHRTPRYNPPTLAIVEAIINENLLFPQTTPPTSFAEHATIEAFEQIHADNQTTLEDPLLSSCIISVLQPFINHSRDSVDRPRTLEEQNRAHAILFTVYGFQAWLIAINSNCQLKQNPNDNLSPLTTTPS